MLMSLIIAAAALAAPQPGTLRTFADWTVGCDNGRMCQAVALLPRDGADGATLALKRGPEAAARSVIWVTLRNEGAESPAYLAVDGRRFDLALDAASQSLRVRDGQNVARLLGQATRIEALDRRGRVLGVVSARGSAAALLAMDVDQRRAGTIGALVRRGSATNVPPAPALPTIISPPVPARAARALGDGRVRQLLGPGLTGCDDAQGREVTTVRLDARTSLTLATHPCGNGAYNVFSTPFLVDERGRVTRARFDSEPGMQPESGGATLVNADWDAARRRLTSFAKARGIGDCGSTQAYAWDGSRFRLVEQSVMGECRGSTDYITTWRARVVGRR